MLINISELLDDELFVQPIEVGFTTRMIDNGRPVEIVDWVVLQANIQTVGDDALQRLPEAERYKPTRQFFTNEREVRVGDYMKYRGQKYRFITDQDFDDYGYADCIGVLYSGVEDIEGDGFKPPFKP